MMSMGFELFIHIIPTLNSNEQLLKDFKKQLSLLVDLVEDRSVVKRQPVFVMFRPSGRLRDEFEDVVHSYIKTIDYHYDDIILIIASNNTTVHRSFLEEMRQRFNFVEAITLSNGSIDKTSNRITFENLKQILIGEFSFKELSVPGLDRHDALTTGADQPFKTTLASDESTSSPVSPIQESQPTSNNETKRDSRDSSWIHPNQQETDANVVSESECKNLSEVVPEETTKQKSTEDDIMNQQDNLHTEIHLKKQKTDTNVVSESECKHLSKVVPEETTKRNSTEEDIINQQDGLDTEEISLERIEVISSDSLNRVPSDQACGITSNLTTQVQQTKRRTSTSFVIEGCMDAQDSPVVFETQTIHDEVEEMRRGIERHQKPIEEDFDLEPGSFLDMLMRLEKELDFPKEKNSENSDFMELSSETVMRLERQSKLGPGKLETVLLALYNSEKPPEPVTKTRQECRSHYSLDYSHSEATCEKLPIVQLKQQQEPPAFFVMEGCTDKQKNPVKFKTQTLHDELEKMKQGDENRPKAIEKCLKLPRQKLLDILKGLAKELDFLKEKTTLKSDHVTLSSATITNLERQFALKSGELKGVVQHLYGNKQVCALM